MSDFIMFIFTSINQCGFKRSTGGGGKYLNICIVIDTSKVLNDGSVFVYFPDVSKAFDCVNNPIIFDLVN